MVAFYECQCEEGFGLSHSHVEAQVLVRTPSGREFTMPKSALEMNPNYECKILGVQPPSIRIWIDWKDVAKALMTNG